jgi:hypothetical protein
MSNPNHLGDAASVQATAAALEMLARIEGTTGPLRPDIRESMLAAATLGYMMGFGAGMEHAYKAADKIMADLAKERTS